MLGTWAKVEKVKIGRIGPKISDSKTASSRVRFVRTVGGMKSPSAELVPPTTSFVPLVDLRSEVNRSQCFRLMIRAVLGAASAP